ncbi:hypothetical protein [Pseudonocardia spinosispora]|uniref:hypothetical protein n=1 Tax=Pseudonocardia spinosispora TaxID=103441 RepID=UPI00041DA455|nr:hypothetical protein [Pseudonocardia spinosispora]
MDEFDHGLIHRRAMSPAAPAPGGIRGGPSGPASSYESEESDSLCDRDAGGRAGVACFGGATVVVVVITRGGGGGEAGMGCADAGTRASWSMTSGDVDGERSTVASRTIARASNPNTLTTSQARRRSQIGAPSSA